MHIVNYYIHTIQKVQAFACYKVAMHFCYISIPYSKLKWLLKQKQKIFKNKYCKTKYKKSCFMSMMTKADHNQMFKQLYLCTVKSKYFLVVQILRYLCS